MSWTTRLFAAALLTTTIALTGCGASGTKTTASKTKPTAAQVPPEVAEEHAKIAEERAKLSPEDRALVDAQEWCAINTDEVLGSMGPPVKIEVKGKPVFLCCAGCKKEALADPDKTLATVEKLKAKKKSGKHD